MEMVRNEFSDFYDCAMACLVFDGYFYDGVFTWEGYMKYLWIFDVDAVAILTLLTGAWWAFGGSGVKMFRKIGVPVTICLSALSVGVAWWLCLLNFGTMFGLMTIPYGDKIRNEWKMNDTVYFLWVGFTGSCYASSLLPLAFSHQRWLWYGVGIPMAGILFGTLTMLSQKINWPKWKWVEISLGCCLGFVAYKLITP